jgi:hypothetical protein
MDTQSMERKNKKNHCGRIMWPPGVELKMVLLLRNIKARNVLYTKPAFREGRENDNDARSLF